MIERLRRAARGDAGLASTEMAILMPFVLILVLIVTFAGKVAQHESRTQAAADAAARSAAFYLTEAEATRAAVTVAKATCNGTATADVQFDAREPADFFPGWVEVEVTCTEQLDRFTVLRGTSERTSTARAVAVREFWRPAP